MDEHLTLSEYLNLAIQRWLRVAELTRRAAEARHCDDLARAARWDAQRDRVEQRLCDQVATLTTLSSRSWVLPGD